MIPELTGATARFVVDFASAETLIEISRLSAMSDAWDRSADRLLDDVRARNRRVATPSHISENGQ